MGCGELRRMHRLVERSLRGFARSWRRTTDRLQVSDVAERRAGRRAVARRRQAVSVHGRPGTLALRGHSRVRVAWRVSNATDPRGLSLRRLRSRDIEVRHTVHT
eukprot:scaffold55786_cov36-Phaeocystis_antarctica.AAC.2